MFNVFFFCFVFNACELVPDVDLVAASPNP